MRWLVFQLANGDESLIAALSRKINDLQKERERAIRYDEHLFGSLLNNNNV